MKAEWKDAKKDFPPFDKDVLCYHEIARTGKDKDKPPFKYFTIGSLECIRTGANYKHADWTDSDHNTITPSHWTELPDSPNIKPNKK